MCKILLIEDDAQNTALVKLRLGAAGFDLVSARTGAEGLAAAQKEAPDLILMDVLLPDMGPSELLKALRACPSAAKAPIIAFTALDAFEMHRRRLEREIDGLIAKPYEASEMAAEIRRVIEESRSQPQVSGD